MSHLQANVSPVSQCLTCKPLSHLQANVSPVSQCLTCKPLSHLQANVSPVSHCLTCEQVNRSNQSKSERTAHWRIVLVWVIKLTVLVRVGRRPVADTDKTEKKHRRYDVEREIRLTTSLYLIPLVGNEVRSPD